MKKITFLSALLAVSLSATAQDFYTFSKSEATYEDLTDAVSINNGETWWFIDAIGPITSPFPLSIFGEDFNLIGFNSGDFVIFENNEDKASFLHPLFTLTIDRGFPNSSQSPISYKVEGNEGSRILKLELKNVGVATEFNFEAPNPDESITYLNFQIWFYEEDSSIEYHYGDHNITDLSVLNDDSISLVGFELYNTLEEGSERAGLVYGEITEPSYFEFADENDMPDNPEETLTLDAVPQPNTVYRFALNPASVDDVTKTAFSLYPNPATERLNVSFNESIYTTYQVYDLTGREIISGTINGENNTQINVGSLQTGTYLLKVNNTTKKFTKK